MTRARSAVQRQHAPATRPADASERGSAPGSTAARWSAGALSTPVIAGSSIATVRPGSPAGAAWNGEARGRGIRGRVALIAVDSIEAASIGAALVAAEWVAAEWVVAEWVVVDGDAERVPPAAQTIF